MQIFLYLVFVLGHPPLPKEIRNDSDTTFSPRKGAPFLEPMNMRLRWLSEMGIINFWRKEVSADFLRRVQNSSHYNKTQVSALFDFAFAPGIHKCDVKEVSSISTEQAKNQRSSPSLKLHPSLPSCPHHVSLEVNPGSM